jgi:hypothetical protein
MLNPQLAGSTRYGTDVADTISEFKLTLQRCCSRAHSYVRAGQRRSLAEVVNVIADRPNVGSWLRLKIVSGVANARLRRPLIRLVVRLISPAQWAPSKEQGCGIANPRALLVSSAMPLCTGGRQ